MSSILIPSTVGRELLLDVLLVGTAPAGGGNTFMLLLGVGLALAAIALFVLELFVPSGGLLSLTCALCVIGSTAAFFMHSPMLGVAAAAIYCILAPMLLVVGLRIWSHSPIARRFILGAADDGDEEDAEVPTMDPRQASGQLDRLQLQAEQAALLGARGIAVTSLRPIGFVTIAGHRIDALAEGSVIDAGTPIEVVEILDNQLKVRPVEAARAPAAEAGPHA